MYFCKKWNHNCMKELKCPHCKKVFQVDDELFESIAGQVRNAEFNDEVARRTEELRERLAAEFKVRRVSDEQDFNNRLSRQQQEIGKRDSEIALLREQLAVAAERSEMQTKAALAEGEKEHQAEKNEMLRQIDALKAQIAQSDDRRQVALLEEQKKSAEVIRLKDESIAELRNKVESEKKDAATMIAALKEQHALVVSEKDREIQYHKDFKTRLSTKMLGETLEIHCQNAFSQAQSLGMFPDAYFAKDNDARTGSKGDFIFRDYADGVEYISIMFEMKNEADTTAVKHRNEDFLEKLDRDRREKNCEYAVLVSMLERDNDLYNDGIVNKSHRYPKMYVIRPQMFMTLIALLCQASRKSLTEISELRAELEVARAQSVDVTNFERRRDQFVESFGKLVEAHVKKHNEAVGGIDKVIEALEKQVESLRKVKSLFETSEQKLVKANESVGSDFTIKKLTRGNPTMKAKFEEARRLEDVSQKE